MRLTDVAELCEQLLYQAAEHGGTSLEEQSAARLRAQAEEIERLLISEKSYADLYMDRVAKWSDVRSELMAARAELTAARQEIERLRNENHLGAAQLLAAQAEIKNLCQEIERWERIWKDGHTVKSLTDQLTAARQEIERLREGRASMREEAARVAELWCAASPDTPVHIAAAIRKLEVRR